MDERSNGLPTEGNADGTPDAAVRTSEILDVSGGYEYGYGIVDKDGIPWWDGSCVCEDRGPMWDIVCGLNDDADDSRRPYRVVALLWGEV